MTLDLPIAVGGFIVGSIVGLTGVGGGALMTPMLVLIFGVWLYQFAVESRLRWTMQLAPVRIGLACAMLIYLAMFAGSGSQGFIYEQF